MSPASLHTPRIRALRDADFGYGFLPWAKGPLWELLEDYTFTIAAPGDAAPCYVIPAGYIFNKASTPPILWGPFFYFMPDGLCTVPSLEHDFLCDLLTDASEWLRARLPKWMLDPPAAALVHEHFEIRLRHFGVKPRKARAWGLAVKIIGPGTPLRRFLQKFSPFQS